MEEEGERESPVPQDPRVNEAAEDCQEAPVLQGRLVNQHSVKQVLVMHVSWVCIYCPQKKKKKRKNGTILRLEVVFGPTYMEWLVCNVASSKKVLTSGKITK